MDGRTNGRTDRRTTRLLELLRAAKNLGLYSGYEWLRMHNNSGKYKHRVCTCNSGSSEKLGVVVEVSSVRFADNVGMPTII